MTTVTASAPARVNIIGEHTDYNDGLVLPSCTALYTRVTARGRQDRQILARSSTTDEQGEVSLDAMRSGQGGGWLEYIKGVAAGLQSSGINLPGADLEIESSIPLGAGLSSSASLELSIARALLALSAAEIDAPTLAVLCQKAEQDYAGVNCGVMDQYAVACAEFGNALLLDCRAMQTSQVKLPNELALILTDSGVRHSHSDNDYNARRDECAAAIAIFAETTPQVSSLRDVDENILQASKAGLGDTLFRRCRHVLTENERVGNVVQACADDDLLGIGEMLTAGHVSLRDDYEVSCAKVDELVDSANRVEAVLGSRMVGGGFGGCQYAIAGSDRQGRRASGKRRNDLPYRSGWGGATTCSP